MTGRRVVIQGFGKVGGPLAFLLHSAGMRVVAVADVGGAVHNGGGLDPFALSDHVAANGTVAGFTGLITSYCQEVDATAIVKGLRSGTDFDYESQMAQMNAELTGVETVFVIADPKFGFVSSSLVKEVASFGGDVASLVPDFVLEPLTARLAQVKG